MARVGIGIIRSRRQHFYDTLFSILKRRIARFAANLHKFALVGVSDASSISSLRRMIFTLTAKIPEGLEPSLLPSLEVKHFTNSPESKPYLTPRLTGAAILLATANPTACGARIESRRGA